MVRVLVVDDHPVVREGLCALLGTQSDITIAGECGDGAEAIALARRTQPDVVLLDLLMPGLSGADVTATLRDECPAIRVIILTSFDGDEDIYRALRAGARAYLLKTASRDELLSTIRDVYAGQRRIPPHVAARLGERLAVEKLTDRELDVLRLIVLGRRNRAIARALGISEGTVKGHVNRILGKLHAIDRTQAATIAIRRGIVHLDTLPKRAPIDAP
ncbi:MAG TPA: response regulator transcription factor [Thermoanaerobaculia bacterium]